MASILCSSPPVTIRASSGSLKPDSNNRKKSAAWWAPIFGLPSEPDYLNVSVSQEPNPGQPEFSGSGQEPGQKVRRGCLTEEKARELRRKIAEASAFHDVMYHSAIASRLASDTSGRVKD